MSGAVRAAWKRHRRRGHRRLFPGVAHLPDRPAGLLWFLLLAIALPRGLRVRRPPAASLTSSRHPHGRPRKTGRSSTRVGEQPLRERDTFATIYK